MPDKYKRQVEAILKRVEEEHPPIPSATRSGSPDGKDNSRFRDRLQQWKPNFPVGKLMAGSLALLLIAVILSATGSNIATLFVIMGVAIFVVSYLLLFLLPRKPYEKRWRGRIIEEDQSFLSKIRRWIVK